MFRTIAAVVIVGNLISSCAHAPKETAPLAADPQVLFNAACPSEPSKPVHGSVWMNVKSSKVSGKFPASVEITDADHLKMEITDLIGSPQAIVTIVGSDYTIESPGKGDRMRKEKGARSWGGIPLEWATRLFSAKIPCPAETQPGKLWLSTDSEGHLVVKVQDERYVYGFRTYAGKPWAESLHWEAGARKIDFTFDEPDRVDDKPRKWEATSDQGEVKVRWKDRQL